MKVKFINKNTTYIYIFIIFFIFLVYFLFFNIHKKSLLNKIENYSNNNNNNRICCIYTYYEKNEKYLDNLTYFIENGINENIDYIIVVNGKCSLDLKNKFINTNNVNIVYRKNIGFDFGSYCYVINNILKKKYIYYFFINTSVKGPYLENRINKDWTIPFIELFNKDDIKVVGTSINIFSPCDSDRKILKKLYGDKTVYSHVQSMFFCIKDDYLEFLKNEGFFNCEETNSMNMNTIIIRKEVGISQIALNNGWNINCILQKYKGLDYRNIYSDINNTSLSGDPYIKNGYFSNSIDKNEVIFFKNNRGF